MARPWARKFGSAFHGMWLAFSSERSFAIHLPMTAAVAICAAVMRVSLLEACVLGLCAALVLVAEIFNTALEFLARETSREQRAGIAAALDMASGAVLLASLGAAAVGGTIFVFRLGMTLGWWK
jgi:diacylglycerol kinase